MSMDEISRIENIDSFILALADYVMKKCEYGDNMSNLSHPERVFYIIQLCKMEVDNGGFVQFFDNWSGNFANEVVDAFQEIGASNVAEICSTALHVFGQELPSNWEKRRELLDEWTSDKSDEIDCILSECDNSFYRYEEDLNTLIYAYVLKNRANFS